MSTTQEQPGNIGAIEFLNDIDVFVGAPKKKEAEVYPAVIHIPLFQSRRLTARIINKLTSLPLRLLRRSTTHFWFTQKQYNHELRRDVDILNAKVAQLRKELQEMKGDSSK